MTETTAWQMLCADQERQIVRLKAALRDVSTDMHNTSSRPCGTCARATQELGEMFGCMAYQAKREGENG